MSNALFDRYLEAKKNYPNYFTQRIATHLNVSEAEILHARVGHDVIPLKSTLNDIQQMLLFLQQFGEVMAFAANDCAIHELIEQYNNVKFLNEKGGLALNPGGIDLRFNFTVWSRAFAVKEDTQFGVLKSIQFFDIYGDSIEKIYLLKKSQMDKWPLFIEQFQAEHHLPLTVEKKPTLKHNPSIDTAALLHDWQTMSNIHHFDAIVAKYNISRLHALHAAENQLTTRVANSAVETLIEQVHADQREIMIFLSNRGISQIFSGKVEKILVKNGWYNIINEKFNLHLRSDLISESWVVKKPVSTSLITSLEIFSATGEQVLHIVSRRAPEQPESSYWQNLLASLPKWTE